MIIENIHFIVDFCIEFNILEWFVGLITTFGLIYFLRAKILVNEINIIRKDNELIRFKIPVINNSRFFAPQM